jgi:hypothetical protein
MTTKTPTFTGPRIHVQGSQNILNKNPNVFRLLLLDHLCLKIIKMKTPMFLGF